jgi:hypothetical protein
VHGKNKGWREEDAVVAECFNGVDVHVIKGLWVLVKVMNLVKSSIHGPPVVPNVPIVLQNTLIDMSGQESNDVVEQIVLRVVKIDLCFASDDCLWVFTVESRLLACN